MKRILLFLAAAALAAGAACTTADRDDAACPDCTAGKPCAECAEKAEMKQCCKDAAALGKECPECAAKK
ncbi:MAG: hypothetical protein D6702_00575 [Planctomycetota bacterium]|nr:MAG: hypothetical protein D6702_00575 [Planctomycetota bacterium]